MVFGLYMALRVRYKCRHVTTIPSEEAAEKRRTFQSRCEYAYDLLFFIGAAASVGLAKKHYDEAVSVLLRDLKAEAQLLSPPGVVTDFSYSYGRGFYLLWGSLAASGIMVLIGVVPGSLHNYHPAHSWVLPNYPPAHSWVLWNESSSSSKEGVALMDASRARKAGKAGKASKEGGEAAKELVGTSTEGGAVEVGISPVKMSQLLF